MNSSRPSSFFPGLPVLGYLLVAMVGLSFLSQCVGTEIVRRPLGRLGKAWLPTEYRNGVRYAGSKGDTIVLTQLSRDTSEVEIAGVGGPDINALSQRLEILLGCDTPYFRIRYTLTAAYNEPLSRNAQDELQVDYESQAGNTNLRLAMGAEPECLSPGCTLRDSLQLRSFAADSVYLSRTDTSLSVLYLNKNDKVVGFRTAANRLYEKLN